jgi:hypothetical protein
MLEEFLLPILDEDDLHNDNVWTDATPLQFHIALLEQYYIYISRVHFA